MPLLLTWLISYKIIVGNQHGFNIIGKLVFLDTDILVNLINLD